jgi:hypothetical protein
MHRIVRLLPRGEVATRVTAIGWRGLQSVIVIDVAARAGHIGVAVGQRKTGGGVVKSDVGPGDRALVAVVAICGGKCRPGSGMRRIIGLLPGREVAAGSTAIGWTNLQIVIVIDVASLTSKIRVAVGQQESRLAVIKFRA